MKVMKRKCRRTWRTKMMKTKKETSLASHAEKHLLSLPKAPVARHMKNVKGITRHISLIGAGVRYAFKPEEKRTATRGTR